MAANATFALNAGVWFRRARLVIVSPDSAGTACPLSGRNSTYRPVQNSGASSSYRMPTKPNLVPLSDGAGEVVEIGTGVTHVKVGDRVAGCFFQRWIGGPPTAYTHSSALGGGIDGMLREYAVLEEDGVVKLP